MYAFLFRFVALFTSQPAKHHTVWAGGRFRLFCDNSVGKHGMREYHSAPPPAGYSALRIASVHAIAHLPKLGEEEEPGAVSRGAKLVCIALPCLVDCVWVWRHLTWNRDRCASLFMDCGCARLVVPLVMIG